MTGLPVSFYVSMIYGLILTATLFGKQFNVLFNSISTNRKVSLSEKPVPYYYRVSYPASSLRTVSSRRE